MKRSTKFIMLASVASVILGFVFYHTIPFGFVFLMLFGGASAFILAPLNESPAN